MKKFLLLLILLSLQACISASIAVNTRSGGVSENTNHGGNNTNTATSQQDPEVLVGRQERKTLEQEPFGQWFNTNFKEYNVDAETTSKITPLLTNVSIKAFMGTWCEDSQRETPVFYKILDQAGFDYQNFELLTVSRDKDTPEGYERGLQIERVPTFIFYKNGKEMGRYVEFARETLEKDILAIVSGASYKHSYED